MAYFLLSGCRQTTAGSSPSQAKNTATLPPAAEAEKGHWLCCTIPGSKDISTSTWILTTERLRSPNRCQRSEMVFHPTCRMIKRPTNLTPKAPARLMPVRLSQNHQGAEKGLKTNKTQEFSLAAGTKLKKQKNKSSSGEGQRCCDPDRLGLPSF